MQLKIKTPYTESDIVIVVNFTTTLGDIKRVIRHACGVGPDTAINLRNIPYGSPEIIKVDDSDDKNTFQHFSEKGINTTENHEFFSMVFPPFTRKLDIRGDKNKEGLLLTIKSLSPVVGELHIDETTTIGQIIKFLVSTVGGAKYLLHIICNGKSLIYGNDPDDRSFYLHLAEYGGIEPRSIHELKLSCITRFCSNERVGMGFIRDTKKRELLESSEVSNTLTSCISGEMIAGDVVKINGHYYGKREFLEYLTTLKEKAESNPAYIPVDPYRRPLPERLAYVITASEFDIFNVLTAFEANAEYSEKVMALDASVSHKPGGP